MNYFERFCIWVQSFTKIYFLCLSVFNSELQLRHSFFKSQPSNLRSWNQIKDLFEIYVVGSFDGFWSEFCVSSSMQDRCPGSWVPVCNFRVLGIVFYLRWGSRFSGSNSGISHGSRVYCLALRVLSPTCEIVSGLVSHQKGQILGLSWLSIFGSDCSGFIFT